MGDPPPQPPRFAWTASQRRALILLLTIFLAVLCVRFATNRGFVSDPPPARGDRSDELASRLDPNTADWQTLAAVPTLGEKRARQIVAYREGKRAAGPVFRTPEDLLLVRGIGPATLENIRPYLRFPADTPGPGRP